MSENICPECGKTVIALISRDQKAMIFHLVESHQPSESELDHDFLPVAGHSDDDECTHRSDGTNSTYCGEPRAAHQPSEQEKK